MKKDKIKLLNYQLITSFLFIISILISILLTYNQKQELLNEKRILNKKSSKYLNLFNRIFALSIIFAILYINYSEYQINKNKRSNLAPYKHQIYASIFSVISAIIVLYVVIENWEDNPNITSIENPII